MPIAKKYLDTFYVLNRTNRTVTLGDLVNLSVPPRGRVDLLTVPRVTKEKINQSSDLQTAVRIGQLKIIKANVCRSSRPKREKQAILSDTDIACQALALAEQVQCDVQESEDAPHTLTLITVTEDYTATDNYQVILADATSNAVEVTLPTADDREGQIFIVKRINNTGYNVTISPNGTETIDQEDCFVLTVGQTAIDMISDGSNWHVI